MTFFTKGKTKEVKNRLRATCVLFDGTESDLGSGFLIAPGFVVTAAHVLRLHAPGDSISLQVGWGPDSRKVKATMCERDSVNDVAVLRLDALVDLEPLPVDTDPLDGSQWFGFGFPQVAGLAGPPVGVPLSGEIEDAGWANPSGVDQFILHCRQNVGGASLKGVSGGPVVADGALVALIVEEFKDGDNLDRSVLGQLKALPIRQVLALLPADARPLSAHIDARGVPNVQGVDLSRLFSWCDRKAVVKQLTQWLVTKPPTRTGLLCIVGHVDNRPKFLIDRVADEISKQTAHPIRASSAWVEDTDPSDDVEFRLAVYNSLQLRDGDAIEQSPKLRGAGGMIILIQCYDFRGWTTDGVEKRLLQAARWLEAATLAQSRLVMVIAIRHGKLLPFVNVEKRIDSAVARAIANFPALGRLMLMKPMSLSDYERNDVLDWADLPLVRNSIGPTASRINDTLLKKWFRPYKTASHGKLLNLLTKFHDLQQ